MQLEHKLKHALDSVRQVEFMRSALIDATSMKEMLQRQVDELKAKNKEMETSKEASSDALSASPDSSSNKMLKDVGKDPVSKEKFHRMRKDLTAAIHSKESKLEVSLLWPFSCYFCKVFVYSNYLLSITEI